MSKASRYNPTGPSSSARLALTSETAGGYFARGTARAEKRDLAGAIADFTRAIEIYPADVAIRGEFILMVGDCSALVTAPLQKQAIAAAGSQFPGHTELLAQRSEEQDLDLHQ